MTFFKLVKKSQYKEKFEPFNEHFKMPMLTFGPYASPGKISEFGVDGHFFRFFVIKKHNPRLFIFSRVFKCYLQNKNLFLIPRPWFSTKRKRRAIVLIRFS